ncbi:hypothetical protein HDU93_003979 [Gonapodya sp. JEL0774]|nr:hypothetical protein HDU93_003979 [Gonapodya sp. JEL0774]
MDEARRILAKGRAIATAPVRRTGTVSSPASHLDSVISAITHKAVEGAPASHLDDRSIVEMILKDSEEAERNYAEMGTRAYRTYGGSRPTLKANTRFLSKVVRATDDHNRSLLENQQKTADKKLRELEASGSDSNSGKMKKEWTSDARVEHRSRKRYLFSSGDDGNHNRVIEGDRGSHRQDSINTRRKDNEKFVGDNRVIARYSGSDGDEDHLEHRYRTSKDRIGNDGELTSVSSHRYRVSRREDRGNLRIEESSKDNNDHDGYHHSPDRRVGENLPVDSKIDRPSSRQQFGEQQEGRNERGDKTRRTDGAEQEGTNSRAVDFVLDYTKSHKDSVYVDSLSESGGSLSGTQHKFTHSETVKGQPTILSASPEPTALNAQNVYSPPKPYLVRGRGTVGGGSKMDRYFEKDYEPQLDFDNYDDTNFEWYLRSLEDKEAELKLKMIEQQKAREERKKRNEKKREKRARIEKQKKSRDKDVESTDSEQERKKKRRK